MPTTHPSAVAGESQCSRILARLQQQPGAWVPMPVLVRVSGGYAVHSRISDLRARGHRIEHRNERRGKIVCSSYRMAAAETPFETCRKCGGRIGDGIALIPTVAHTIPDLPGGSVTVCQGPASGPAPVRKCSSCGHSFIPSASQPQPQP